MPIGGDALAIVGEWVNELARDHLWGPNDPLFPATQMGLDDVGGFIAKGLSRKGWATGAPVREIFKRSFARAGLPYFNPHSFRDMMVRHAMTLNLSAEAMKAWSQNLGHNDVLTTFTSYGSIPAHRQGELIRSLGSAGATAASRDEIASIEGLLSRLKAGGTSSLPGEGG